MSATTVDTAAAEQARARIKQKPVKGPSTPWWLYVIVLAIVVFCLLPFYWLVNISLKTGPDLSNANLVPPHPSLKNYSSIFQNSSFTRALANSAIVSLTTTFIGVIVGSFAAYALARLKMRGKFILLGIVLSITTFPQIAIAAPLFRLWSNPPLGLPHLYNTLIGLIIPYLTFALPLSIYISSASSAKSPETSKKPRSSTAPPTSKPSAKSWSHSPHPAWRPPPSSPSSQPGTSSYSPPP
jgi:multiple sugar transport system permease protein